MKPLFLSFLLLSFVSFAQSIPEKPEDVSPLLVGETIADVSLLNAKGELISLKAIAEENPTLLIFYRGGWCPYCTKHLADVAKVKNDLKTMNIKIVAISTDSPLNLQTTADKTEELDYMLLSDNELIAAKAFGLAFRGPERYAKTLLNGSGGKNTDNLLPVPAVFLLDKQGIIKYEHINPNYKERISGDVLLAVAKAMIGAL